MTPSTVYLSGPMSGLPEFNYPAFNAAAARLRALGYRVENPAENPEPPCGSWAGYMRFAVRQVALCGVIVLLPGWRESRGAMVEVFLAKVLGLEVFDFSDFIARHESRQPGAV